VWERDGGRCTFVSESGKRCGSNRFLELDHVQPVACGGLSTVENLRVVCRAHNQYAAEQVFGVDFVEAKREAAREARREAEQARKRLEAEAKAAATRARALAAAEQKRQAAEAKDAAEHERKAREAADNSLVSALRRLGFSTAEVHWAIEQGEALRGARLEDRVRHALRVLNAARGKPSERAESAKT
jgi:membrane protein involved in colicin uptake